MTELELEFAQSPESAAYVPLCEAYLEQGRFMEAMVVCKKGIKAHPDSIDARILLARVYAEQKKYKRALTELDDLVQAKGDSGAAHLARGRVRLESGDEAGAIADLKRALDLDRSLEDATAILAEKGIVYPEPPPEPPQIRTQSFTALPTAPPGARAASILVGPPAARPGSGLAPPRPGSVTGPPRLPSVAPWPDSTAQARPDSVVTVPRGASLTPIQPAYQGAPQRLEGEDELEQLAQKIADEKPPRGKPKTTLMLVGALAVVSAITLTYRFVQKTKIEAIDRLTGQALPEFNRDTYGSYKRAAELFEQILQAHDGRHKLTLGRLAHTYAILWGEHGDRELRPKLDEILKRAKKDAPDVSHTSAAETLSVLYTGDNRQEAAEKARQIAEPVVERTKEGGAAPTHANLALGIVELELGEYEEAVKRLDHVAQVLPGSVRAKVWHARAAFRASRLGTAQGAFQAALRAEPNHPGALAGLALARLGRGDLNGAAESLLRFDKLAREYPKDISPRDAALAEFARSEILRSAGEAEKAVGAYEQAIRLDPGNADFPYGLGRWFLEHGDPSQALEPLRKAVQMEPNRWAFLVDLAEAEMQVRQFDKAEELIDKALKRAPSYLPAALARSRLLRRVKRQGAEAYLAELLKKSPSAGVDVRLELGLLYREEGRTGDARKAFEEAIEAMGHHPQGTQAKVLMAYASLMEDQGERKVAIESYRQAAERGDIEGWYRLALVLQKGGREDRDEAKKACERYLAAGSSLRYSKEARALCR